MQTVNEPPASVLEKVRALLSKAESTEFEAEAEALTDKAQELMARYRIEQVMLDADGTGPRSRPTMMTITIADPYADPKSLLLSSVARANGCTTVWQKWHRTASVFGFADDLAAVDALFTSLLVQSAVALHRAGPQRDKLGRSRTARFRRSFLIAFAVRVGERLREAVDATVEEMAGSTGPRSCPSSSGVSPRSRPRRATRSRTPAGCAAPPRATVRGGERAGPVPTRPFSVAPRASGRLGARICVLSANGSLATLRRMRVHR